MKIPVMYQQIAESVAEKCGAWVRFEWLFDPDREYRFDIAFPGLYIAVEIDGGIWSGGGHTRGAGYMKDQHKINTAQLYGWRVYRVTPEDIGTGYFTRIMEQALQAAGEENGGVFVNVR